jgi:hypothetical protein
MIEFPDRYGMDEAAPHGPIVTSHRSPCVEARKQKGRDPSMAARNDPDESILGHHFGRLKRKTFQPAGRLV